MLQETETIFKTIRNLEGKLIEVQFPPSALASHWATSQRNIYSNPSQVQSPVILSSFLNYTPIIKGNSYSVFWGVLIKLAALRNCYTSLYFGGSQINFCNTSHVLRACQPFENKERSTPFLMHQGFLLRSSATNCLLSSLTSLQSCTCMSGCKNKKKRTRWF